MQLATRDNDTTIAKKVGISPSTVGRWRSGEIDPKPRQVVAFARAYHKSPLAALVAADYLSAEDLDGDLPIGSTHDLDEITTNALIDELSARIEAMNQYIGWMKAIGEGVGSPANLSAQSLRTIDPATPPSETDGMVFIEAIREQVEVTATIAETPIYGLRTKYVAGDIPLHIKEQLAAAADRVSGRTNHDVGGAEEDIETRRQDEHALAAKKRSKNRGEVDYS